jgi:hypothetical protein
MHPMPLSSENVRLHSQCRAMSLCIFSLLQSANNHLSRSSFANCVSDHLKTGILPTNQPDRIGHKRIIFVIE